MRDTDEEPDQDEESEAELEDEGEADEEEDDDVSEEGRSGAAGFALGIAIGALVGAAAALLLAPDSGQVTRRRLRRGLGELKERAEDEWDALSKKARRELRRRIET